MLKVNKKYSVLMSLYDKENPSWFVDSLMSMIKQTVQPSEIIIVLDGPITGSLQAEVNRFKEAYPEMIKIIPLKNNIGLGKALDEGLKHCSYDLVARMDTDDISLPSRCEEQLKKFEKEEDLSIVGTYINEFYDEPDNIISSRQVPTTQKDIKEFIKRRSPFNHPTVMFKKNDVINCGGYGKLRRKQDLDLFSRMINSGYKGSNIDKSLVLFRSNEENFKRRKSWSYVKSYIIAQHAIWRRGHCSMLDLVVVTSGQLFMYLAPMSIMKKVSNKYLRKSI